ncbi:Tvp18p [Ascoidea rubescens DSM 1968]|uniref:Golgi apparatus membrane protein TVP18 n=1 Tax=Ascoidea rubescens DSM 1968 TaxID=1344418 RepID=A0A1D2VBT4_9ASCO|nr:Golgi apparatus membrane protein TVP18 [Ascoidea rubescens DSM 1968]ODV59148.1 Golgi apparatus membrane protein TVP18 [Ascoidea rubescens DSM 1968]
MAFSMQILKSSFSVGVDKFKNDMGSRNYGIYGKWIGILTFFLCLALGVANIFHFSLVIIFSILAIVQGFLILFIELPFLLKICPFTDKFVNIMKKFNENWPRAGFYLLMAVVQFLSLIVQTTSLLALAILMLISSICYAFSAFSHQEFHNGQDDSATNLPNEAVLRQVL